MVIWLLVIHYSYGLFLASVIFRFKLFAKLASKYIMRTLHES
jgi:hypothetical protein